MKLYELSTEYNAILDMMESEEIDETEFHGRLADLSEAIEVKSDGVCKVIRTLEAQSKAYKAEADMFAKKRMVCENSARRLKQYLEDQMREIGVREIQGEHFKAKIQLNNPSVNVTDEMLIPSDYLIPVDPKLDKKGILEQLKNGEEIPGCELQRTESVRIR